MTPLATDLRFTPGSVVSALRAALSEFVAPVFGVAAMLGLWWMAGLVLTSDPRFAAFQGFAIERAFASFGDLLVSSRLLENAVQLPFQILRMVSPLAWMPIAIIAFASWDGAIVFLITAAAIWPILFATAAGVKRIDPVWTAMARNLGGRHLALLKTVIVPAVAQDILTGLRLALGVAWVVLVPAEYLGVTSGLGYAINDARDTLSYDRLAALVLLIGLIGYALDAAIGFALRRAHWVPSI